MKSESIPERPRIPPRETVLTRYYTGNGDYTEAFRRGIEDLYLLGGGRLVVPRGVWRTGAIQLRSGIELHLAEGAEIQFSSNPDDCLPVVYQQRGGVRCYNYSSFLYAHQCEDIAITGKGSMQGQGHSWWHWKEQQPGMHRLMEMGRHRTPIEERIFGKKEDGVRPDFIQFIDCRRIAIEGVQLLAGPAWMIHPVWCDEVTVRDVTVISHGPNNDGIDPDGCRNVLIEHCFVEAGDDAICLKSGRDQEGWDVGRACENVCIRHCEIHGGHGAIVLGSEMSGGIRNVHVHDIFATGTDSGVRIKTRRGRGGIIENVVMEDITMKRIHEEAVVIDMQYGDGTLGEKDVGVMPRTFRTPTVRDIIIRRLTCRHAGQAIRIRGLPENPIRGVKMEELQIRSEVGPALEHVEDQNLNLNDSRILCSQSFDL